MTFPDAMYGGPQQPAFVSSVQALTNIPLSPDLNAGNPTCVSYVPNVSEYFDDLSASFTNLILRRLTGIKPITGPPPRLRT